jgi:hypothetical protein
MKAKSICVISLLCLAAIGTLFAADAKATEKEQDGWTIFNMSYMDASIPAKRKFIEIVKDEDGRTLNYMDLRLSCGTHMNGSLKESVADGVMKLKGAFAVSSNPYGIANLEVDLSRVSENKPWDGRIVVDGVTVDVNDARGF